MDLHTSNTESEAGLDHRRAKRTRDLWHVGLNPARSLVECPGTPSACCRRARAALDTRGAITCRDRACAHHFSALP